MSRPGIGGGDPLLVQEVQRGSQVSGDKVDSALLEGRLDDLAGAQPRHDLDWVAVLAQDLAVQLGQGLALGEVERGDGDDGPPRVLGRWAFSCRGAPAGHQDDHS
jgi:hypothetical protein